MKKQVDALGVADGAVACKSKRIDTIKGKIVAAADQGFELGDDAGAPSPGLLDLGHLAFEESFLDVMHFPTQARF
jgi:hypothetical protein